MKRNFIYTYIYIYTYVCVLCILYYHYVPLPLDLSFQPFDSCPIISRVHLEQQHGVDIPARLDRYGTVKSSRIGQKIHDNKTVFGYKSPTTRV